MDASLVKMLQARAMLDAILNAVLAITADPAQIPAIDRPLLDKLIGNAREQLARFEEAARGA